MSLRLEITPAFRAEYGDEAATDWLLAQVRTQLLTYIKDHPGRFRFGTVISAYPEKADVDATQDKVDQVVQSHKHDGLCETSLRFVLENAALAPLGPALEIGSFKGGTALALLALRDWPLLVTVDPYGSKDYKGGDFTLTWEYGGYDDAVYVAHKCNLSTAENHAHFLMTGEEFLERVVGSVAGRGAKFWKKGIEHSYSGFGFAFVDGEHDKETVMCELELLYPHMLPQGRIIVDNIDKDPTLEAALREQGWTIGPAVDKGAMQALWVC